MYVRHEGVLLAGSQLTVEKTIDLELHQTALRFIWICRHLNYLFSTPVFDSGRLIERDYFALTVSGLRMAHSLKQAS